MTFPQSQLWKVVNDGEVEPIGTFSVSTVKGDLVHVRVPIIKVGTFTGGESFRIKVWNDSGFTRSFAVSTWTDLSAEIPLTGSWRGLVRFDFDYEPLATSETYHMSLESLNYTRNGDTLYVGVGLNHPLELSGSGYLGSSCLVYVSKRVSYGVG